MNVRSQLMSMLLGTALIGMGASRVDAQPPGGKGLDSKVTEAWKKAGFEVGWYVQQERGSGQFSKERPKSPSSLPAFRWRLASAGVLGKLPAPPIPFALDLRQSAATNAEIKELVGFKNLRILNADATGISDPALTTISGFKDLQTLSIYNANVTSKGLKQLARLKSLKVLVINLPIGTISGTAEGIAYLTNTRRDLKVVLLD